MQQTKFSFEAIGTTWQIDIFEELNQAKRVKLLREISELIELFERSYSRFQSDSLVSQMAKQAGRYNLPADAKPLLDFYKAMNQLSKGIFTPCIGQMLVEAGYDANYSLAQKSPLTSPFPFEKLAYTNDSISLPKPVLLDFGAAGKGYLLDLIVVFLEREKHPYFCLDAGGDIFYQGQKGQKLKVGLENPANLEQVLGILELEQGSLCSSAGNRRKWNNFHHIINPQTKSSPTKVLATWVKTPQAMLADGLATALFLIEPEILESKYHFDYLIVYNDYTTRQSTGFKAKLFN